MSNIPASTVQDLADLFTAGIGESLLKKPKGSIHTKARNIQAVCNAARRLFDMSDQLEYMAQSACLLRTSPVCHLQQPLMTGYPWPIHFTSEVGCSIEEPRQD